MACRRALRAVCGDRERLNNWRLYPDLLPGILKPRASYDSKGQVRVKTPAELAAAWAQSVGKVPCVLEQMLPLRTGCSVIVARGADGAMVHLPGAAQPAPRRDPGRDRVYEGFAASANRGSRSSGPKSVANGLNGTRCCVRFACKTARGRQRDGPRPHNSGAHGDGVRSSTRCALAACR